MTTTRSADGALRHAPGSPASSGGRYAPEAAPAAAGALTTAENDREAIWRSERPRTADDARLRFGSNGVFVVQALDHASELDDEKLCLVGEDAAIVGIDGREITTRLSDQLSDRSIDARGFDETVLAAHRVLGVKDIEQPDARAGAELAVAHLASISFATPHRGRAGSEAQLSLRLDAFFERFDHSLLHGYGGHPFPADQQEAIAQRLFADHQEGPR